MIQASDIRFSFFFTRKNTTDRFPVRPSECARGVAPREWRFSGDFSPIPCMRVRPDATRNSTATWDWSPAASACAGIPLLNRHSLRRETVLLRSGEWMFSRTVGR